MNVFKKVFRFYYEGFRDMPRWGKQMWIIILLKGFLVFIVVKFLFFPNFLNSNFETDEEKSEYILQELINKSKNDRITTER